MIKKLLWMMFFVMCLCTPGWAVDLFYSGSIGIDSIDAEVNIQDTAAVTLAYTLSNRGTAPEQVKVDYWEPSVDLYSGGTPLQNSLQFRAGEQKSLVVTYTTDIPDGEPKTFALDPTLLFDGKFHPGTTEEMVITVMLPKGVRTLISANKDPHLKERTGEGRVRYEWKTLDDYPTPLMIKWTSLGIDLNVSKEVSVPSITERNRELRIIIVVQNGGEEEVHNLIGTDNFVPSDFEPIEPMSEFFTPDTNKSDPRVIWRKNLGTIKPGEVKRISYAVRYIGNLSQSYDIELAPTGVFRDNTLVGVSNTVRVSLLTTTRSSNQESPQTTTPLSVGVVFCALVITGVLALVSRKQR